jgi:enterobactin synthetase component D
VDDVGQELDVETASKLARCAGHLEAGNRGFIRHVERLLFSGLSGVVGLRCCYDTSAFDDMLYATFGIYCPENVRLAVIKRRAEYLAGRHLGRILLGERGLPTRIATGKHRQPLWCAGWIGSITHTNDVAACCIAPRAHSGILGIDVEHWFDADTTASIGMSIVDSQEEDALARGPWSYPNALTLAFSAKESLFKAIYPNVGNYFDFDCAKWIDADYTAGTFVLQIAKTLSPVVAAGSIYCGHFECWESCVFTLIAIDSNSLG